MAVHLLTREPDATVQSHLERLASGDVLVLLVPIASRLSLSAKNGPQVFFLATSEAGEEGSAPPGAHRLTAAELVELIARDGPAITWGG